MQRFSWLTWLLLLSALGISAAVEDQSVPFKPDDNVDTTMLRSRVKETEIFHQFEFVDNVTLSAAFSGCGLCQATGQCDRAFHGQPGHFCIKLTSGAPCCCPQDAQCAANPYECRCRHTVPYHYGRDDYHPHSSSSGVLGTFIFFLLLLLCCVCCCYLPARRAQREREEQVEYAQPVATNQYGTYAGQQSQVPYAYASAPVAYEASPYCERGEGGNTMAVGALGALGGLGVGAALGSAFGGHNNNNRDYSGDVGGVSDNTYMCSGDAGGGDFSGDCGYFGGDDGTFAGDS
ncbi:unnamed protein product [Peronospora destructor]|uniref:Uncharacterized protein n=1 Tax=Peronospora destructor TaxID=86335 RepID=A0AAV0VCT8_9STRA|nr:unnamed protein product [Peronospora destructor]CAI5746972.1 unnamed protein product [Peronospora destructor]